MNHSSAFSAIRLVVGLQGGDHLFATLPLTTINYHVAQRPGLPHGLFVPACPMDCLCVAQEPLCNAVVLVHKKSIGVLVLGSMSLTNQ